LAEDAEAQVVNSEQYTGVSLLHERIITKAFNHYGIPLQITDSIRASFKAKLWRMGTCFAKSGGIQRPQLLQKWEKG